MAPIARRFERFSEMYRRPDGRRWGGQDLQDATGGVVTRSYVTNLRKGRIENPGFEKVVPDLMPDQHDASQHIEASDTG